MKQLIKKIATILAATSILMSGLVFAQDTKDTTVPSDVENVKAVAGDGQVNLSWDPSTDNVGVTGYKIYLGTESVADGKKDYNLPMIDAGNVQNYVVKDLKNGTTYYFALTAADKGGNESEYYSTEVSATPQGATPATPSGEDKSGPTVSSTTANGNTEVKVVFSEEIVLPSKAPESAFSIQDQAVSKPLVIIAAQLDPKDTAGKTVLLTTEPQEIDTTYVLTVGIGVTDAAGNPIESGVSDTASFKGGSEKSATTDSVSPKISAAKGLSHTTVQLEFSEPVILGDTPQANFKISQSSDQSVSLAVTNAEIDSNDPNIILLTTEAQKPTTEYVVEVSKVADKSGNLIAEGFDSTAIFTSTESDLADVIPPEDVTKFVAKMTSTMAKLSWTASLNSAGDLADQILYQSLDKGKTYGQGKSLGATVSKYDVKDLKPNTEYTFKLTVKDKVGNESKGVVINVKTLPQTGPELGLLVLAALGAAGYVTRKKK